MRRVIECRYDGDDCYSPDCSVLKCKKQRERRESEADLQALLEVLTPEELDALLQHFQNKTK